MSIERSAPCACLGITSFNPLIINYIILETRSQQAKQLQFENSDEGNDRAHCAHRQQSLVFFQNINAMRIFFFAGMLVALMLSACTSQTETKDQTEETQVVEDIVQAAPDEVKMIYENEFAQLMHVRLEAGESLPMHEGQERAIYALGEYQLEWTDGETTKQSNWKKGQMHWHEAGKHAVKNVGTQPAEYLVVRRTGEKLPECDMRALANDVYEVVPDMTTPVFDNAKLRVTKVTLPAGESIPEHAGINRLIYALSDYEIHFTSESEGSSDKSHEPGDVEWHDGCMHAVKNIGGSPAEYLVLAFRE